MRHEADVNRSHERDGEKVSNRSKAALAVLGALAVLLVTGRNVLLYGWSQGTILATIATVPIAVVLYFIILRRWSR